MGIVPLTWQEIRAWRLENELHLAPFEIRAIRTMSQEYASEYGQASEKDRPAPYNTVEIEEQSFKVGKSMLKSLLGANAAKNSDEPRYEVELRED